VLDCGGVAEVAVEDVVDVVVRTGFVEGVARPNSGSTAIIMRSEGESVKWNG